jgi:sirohydrochlorin cobaltochelatase
MNDTHDTNDTHGLLLFAHGARDPAWARPFQTIADHMRRESPGRPVALAFLELMTPNLAAGVAELVEQGCTAVTVVPLFLGAGGHVRRDLPLLLEAARAQWPAVAIDCTAAIGELDAVTLAIARAALTLIAPPPESVPSP